MKRHPLLAGGGGLFPCYIAADKNLHLLHGSNLSVSAERYFFRKFDISFLCAMIAEPDMVVRIRRRSRLFARCFLFVVFVLPVLFPFFVYFIFRQQPLRLRAEGHFLVGKMSAKVMRLRSGIKMDLRRLVFGDVFSDL